MKKLFVVLAILFIGILLAGCTSQPPAPVVTPTPTPVPTTAVEVRGCYAVIADDPQLSVLGTALGQRNLKQRLIMDRLPYLHPMTMRSRNYQMERLQPLTQGSRGSVKTILLNHVIDRTLLSVDVTKLNEAKTMQGTVLKVNYTGDAVTIGGAKVTKTDIVCKNGVIHVVDRVIVPPVTVITATPTPTPSPTPQPSVTITFTRDLTIMPSTTVYVPVGGKVIWKNDDPMKPHGIAALDNPDPASLKYFSNQSAQNIPYGKTYEVTFNQVGRYNYKTVFQPETTGQIIVTK